MPRIRFFLAICFLAGLMNAEAYVDPGVGSALFQALYALIFGSVFAWILKPWQWIKSFLSRSDKGKPEDLTENRPEE